MTEQHTEEAVGIKPGGLWGAETSATLDAQFPISVVCSTTELDSNFATPISRLRDEQTQREFATRDASLAISRITDSLMKLADLALNAGDDARGRRIQEILSTLVELRRANNQMAEVQEQYADPAYTRDVIGRWFSGLDFPRELQRVFYSNDLNINGGITGGQLLNQYAVVAAQHLWEQARPTRFNVDYLYRTLGDFPVPVFGSKPTGLGNLQNTIAGSSFVAAITVAYETEGPALAIFTATMGILVWFGKPPAKVVRQATKNWLANKLNVKEIED
jgi:hypothetical protein